MIKCIERLREDRQLFHNEADFQHALAWEIHTQHKNFKVRLEKKEEGRNFDIIVNDKTAIELKYKTLEIAPKKKAMFIKNESYVLMNQGAQDHGRYDFIKDLTRLEWFVKKRNGSGFAIFLTNDHLYWAKRNKDTIDKAFNIDKSIERGVHGWNGGSKGTTQGRNQLRLEHGYKIKWEPYSNIQCERNKELRYLLVEVK